MADNTTTLLPGGISNAAIGSTLSTFTALDPTKNHVYFNDFDTYVAADWTVTETQAGATEALTAGDGGLLLITNTATENDLVSMQLIQETFRLETGKQIWMKFRFKVSDATQSDIMFGLVITDTSPFDATDGVWFQKLDGSTSVTLQVVKDSTASSVTVGTMANNTNVVLGLAFDPDTGMFSAYYNDSLVGHVASTNLPDDEDLAVTMSHATGAAGAQTMTVDYVLVAKER